MEYTSCNYVDYLSSTAEDYILPSDRYGDWLSANRDWKRGGPLSVSTGYYYYVTSIVTVIEGRESRESYDSELLTTYYGVESVSVPAGDFDACRFTETSTLTSPITGTLGPYTTTFWVGVGFGLWIKSSNELPFVGEQTWEMVSATINGDSIP